MSEPVKALKLSGNMVVVELDANREAIPCEIDRRYEDLYQKYIVAIKRAESAEKACAALRDVIAKCGTVFDAIKHQGGTNGHAFAAADDAITQCVANYVSAQGLGHSYISLTDPVIVGLVAIAKDVLSDIGFDWRKAQKALRAYEARKTECEPATVHDYTCKSMNIAGEECTCEAKGEE
jgi:alpha-D-ribose 1-methylphosphonate 5-triphosphate synthase subunit PhnG